jgi:hypothetical protein
MNKQTVAPRGLALAPAQAVAAFSLPSEIRELLGPAPLLSWEGPERYERVLAAMAQAVGPRDWIEWVWTKDLVDLGWEAARARRAQAAAVGLAYEKALAHLMGNHRRNLVGDEYRRRIARLSSGDPKALRAFRETLDGMGLRSEGVSGEAAGDAAYLLAMDDIEPLGLIIARCEARRDAILREMDRRREFKARMRAALPGLEDAVDAQFDDLDGAD